MIIAASSSSFEALYARVSHETARLYEDAVLWLHRRSDGEQLIIACVFILILLVLIVKMSMRRDDSTSRNFGSSIVLVLIFAFGLGWMMDSGAGSWGFVFNS